MSLDSSASVPPQVPSLRDALRRARSESAERSGVLVELRTAEMARLDLLKEALEPVLAQVPEDIDLFESALMPGDPARLFVDQLGFVEMGADKRTYRFFQDTRYGRRLIAESEKLPVILPAMTDYIARRMVEREKALASDLVETAPAAAAPRPAAAPAEKPRRGARLVGLVALAAIAAFVVFFILADLWQSYFAP
ncbi:MAG TPA: hypothetical protein VHD15_01865 [Hyphomicrobiales bacterium]|nr:hypothetical protein [Hyphomicrobiales bacterium]